MKMRALKVRFYLMDRSEAVDMRSYSIKQEIKDTLSLGIPLVFSYLVYAASGFIGTAMVARLGKDALAASILVSIIWASLSVFFFGILNAVSVLVSHQYGAKNKNAICEIMGQSYFLGSIICIPIILLLYTIPFILTLTDQPPDVILIAIQYMKSLLWTIPGLIGLIISQQFLAGIGCGNIIFRISMLVVPTEIALSYAFVFGKFGFPTCGIAGVGYGFAITYTVAAVGLALFLSIAKSYKEYRIFSNVLIIKFAYLKELIRVGLPLGIMQVIEITTFAFATFWIADFGTTMLAAHQIAIQYFTFAITLIFSMSGAIAIRVGHAVGRKDMLGVKYAVYVGMFLNLFFVAFISAAFYFFPKLFLQIDLNVSDPINASLIKNASTLLEICCILLLFDNFRIIIAGTLRGLKDTIFTMYSSFASFWMIGIPSAYLFGFILHLQGCGIWCGLTFAIIIGAIINFIRLQYLVPRLDFEKTRSISCLTS
jgi:MATE family multidrug resistance protein